MNAIVSCVIVSAVITVIFFVVHMVAMYMVKGDAMNNHYYLALQAFVTGLLFCLACKFIPALKDCCCNM